MVVGRSCPVADEIALSVVCAAVLNSTTSSVRVDRTGASRDTGRSWGGRVTRPPHERPVSTYCLMAEMSRLILTVSETKTLPEPNTWLNFMA